MKLTKPQVKKLREIVEATQSEKGYTFVNKDNPSIKKIVTTYELAMVNDGITDDEGKVAYRATDAGIEFITNLDAVEEAFEEESSEEVEASLWGGPIPAVVEEEVRAPVVESEETTLQNPFEVTDDVEIDVITEQEELSVEVDESVPFEPVEEVEEVPALPETPRPVSDLVEIRPYLVEKDITLPPRSSRHRRSKYPFDEMEVGDSFFVKATPEKKNPYSTLTSSCGGANRRYKVDGKKFVVRHWEGGCRVFCVGIDY